MGSEEDEGHRERDRYIGGESELRVTWKDIGTHKSKCVLTGACS